MKGGKIVSAGNLDVILTSENIKSVFQVDAVVKRHSITNSLYVVPILMPKPPLSRNLSVHLICGAGTGTTLMKILVDEGYNVTAGVLNLLDTDYETAQLLKIPVISEAPFSPITEEAHRANLEMISKASAVVLTEVPFGYGNLRNLEAAKEALKRGKMIIVIEETRQQRDFTNGRAQNLLRELKSKGAIAVKSYGEALSKLEALENEVQGTKNGCRV